MRLTSYCLHAWRPVWHAPWLHGRWAVTPSSLLANAAQFASLCLTSRQPVPCLSLQCPRSPLSPPPPHALRLSLSIFVCLSLSVFLTHTDTKLS